MNARNASWLERLSLRDRLLVHLASAQSRYEHAMVARFRDTWTEKEIRGALRELHDKKHLNLLEVDRVRWALSVRGMNAARSARERAQRAAAA